MEFKFAVNDVFRQPVVQIGPNLLPPGFTGDRRAFWDTVGKVSEVVNAMGEASAAAQGLTKPITTAERLRNSEHTVYLLIDQNAANGRGAVTGMLKTGKKGLYVFDRNGQHYQVSPPCVLDFYVHESRQRTGLGKRLFEHMLQAESIHPVKMAIDRPSEKFLGFLNKHYSLNNPVKQMNNYVVFDGFFPNSPEKNGTVEVNHSTLGKKESANGLQTSFTSPIGRYGAPRPHCSMGQIIHNQTSTIPKSTEPQGVECVRSAPVTNYEKACLNNPSHVSQSVPHLYCRHQQPKIKLDGLSQERVYPDINQNDCYQKDNNLQSGVVAGQNYYNNQQYTQQRDDNYTIPQQTMYNDQPAFVQQGNTQNTVPDTTTNQHPNITNDAPNIPSQNTQQQQQQYPLHHTAGQHGMENDYREYKAQQISYGPEQILQYPANYTSNQIQTSIPQVPPNSTNYHLSNQTHTPSDQTQNIIPQPQLNPYQQNYQQPIENVTQQYNTYVPQNIPQHPTNIVPQNQQYQPTQSNPQLGVTSTNNLQPSSYPQNVPGYGYNTQQIIAPTQVEYNPIQYPSAQRLEYTTNSKPIIPNNNNNMSTNYNTETSNQYNATINNQLFQQQSVNTGAVTNVEQLQHQSQPTVRPIQSQPIMNQNQNFVPNAPKQSISQTNENINYNKNNIANQPRNINESARYTLPYQPPQSEFLVMNSQMQHMEGQQLNKPNEKISQISANNAQGDVAAAQELKTVEYGYPSQVSDSGTQIVEEISSSPKLERPRSLSIQLSEDQTEDKKDDVESEVPPNENQDEEVVEFVSKMSLSENGADPEPKVETIDTQNKTPGKKTPSHLTEQGFFDLKFYHNKLW